MFNLKSYCWNINLNSESPRPFPTPNLHLSLLGTEIALGKKLLGKPRKAQTYVYVHTGENKDGSCWAGHWAIKSRSETSKPGFLQNERHVDISRNLVNHHRIRYLRSEPIFPRSEEGRSSCYLTAAHVSLLVNRSEGPLWELPQLGHNIWIWILLVWIIDIGLSEGRTTKTFIINTLATPLPKSLLLDFLTNDMKGNKCGGKASIYRMRF